MDFYEEIISNIDNDSIIHLMTELGADRYVEREDWHGRPLAQSAD